MCLLFFRSRHRPVSLAAMTNRCRDPTMFTDKTLSGFDGVMFVSNSDEGML